MQRYYNHTGKSDITHFKIEKNKIFITFENITEPLEFSYESDGVEHVEQLKQLALSGKGLSRYVQKCLKIKAQNLDSNIKKKSILSKITLGWL